MRNWIITLTVLGCAAPAMAQLSANAGQFRTQLLPLGSATESQASAIIINGQSGDDTIIVGNSIVNSVQRPTVWYREGQNWSAPRTLIGTTFGGNATTGAVTGNSAFVAGSIFDSQGRPQPCVWDDTDVVHVLPSLTGQGEANALLFGADVTECYLAGWVLGPDGLSHAVVWNGNLQDGMSMTILATEGVSGRVNDLDWNPDGSLTAVGTSTGANGRMTGVYWNLTLDWTHSIFVKNPIGFTRSNVNGYAGSVHVAAGDVNGDGYDLPCLWNANPNGTTPQLLPLPPGAQGGTVQSIIAVLIGFMAVGQVEESGTPLACVWQKSGNGYYAYKLQNTMISGVVYRPVIATDLQATQENNRQTVLVCGTAEDSYGRLRAYVASQTPGNPQAPMSD